MYMYVYNYLLIDLFIRRRSRSGAVDGGSGPMPDRVPPEAPAAARRGQARDLERKPKINLEHTRS